MTKSSYLGAVLRVVLKLVNELVNDIPQPLIGQFHIDRALIGRVDDVVEHLAVVLERLDAVLVRWARLKHVEMAEVKFYN